MPFCTSIFMGSQENPKKSFIASIPEEASPTDQPFQEAPAAAVLTMDEVTAMFQKMMSTISVTMTAIVMVMLTMKAMSLTIMLKVISLVMMMAVTTMPEKMLET